jgi:hypothetical protein
MLCLEWSASPLYQSNVYRLIAAFKQLLVTSN